MKHTTECINTNHTCKNPALAENNTQYKQVSLKKQIKHLQKPLEAPQPAKIMIHFQHRLKDHALGINTTLEAKDLTQKPYAKKVHQN